MDGKSTSNGAANTQTGDIAPQQRKRRSGADPNVHVRYFLPKDGTSVAKPELGRELPTEGDALIAALTAGRHFFAVTTWTAKAEVNGGNPVIVKQPHKGTAGETERTGS